MCGIAGIFDTSGKREIERIRLEAMADVQLHRGPDGGGYHVERGVGLAHRRLAIIDLSTGQQPLYNEDESVVVVFNGEIYNYLELIPELVSLGHRFRTRSDTEVIVHAWEAWGPRCVERFRGMFAFALWDRKAETLFLARDRLGVKPLHYALLGDGHLIFGSELKALCAYGGFSRAIEPLAVEDYFALGYVPEPRTIYQGVFKLPPGHTLTVTRRRPLPEPVSFWDVTFSLDSRLTEAQAEDELLQRLRESVRLRMIADVPLGAFLSGGVDSSAVVAVMAGLSASPVETCSIAFADGAFDESEYAAAVATRYATRHHVEQVASDDFALLPKLAELYDEPYADSSALPTYRLCEMARRHVTVALSGDGGDESFAGYSRYRTFLREEARRRMVPLAVRRPVFGSLAALYPPLVRAPRFLRARSTLRGLSQDTTEAYFDLISVLRGEMRTSLYSARFRKELGGYSTVELFRAHARRANTDDPLSLIQYLDLKTYLAGDINTKVDRASMAHSLEVREPLMDHELVQWLAGLPGSLKVSGGEGKHLLKKTMEPFLPRDVLYRRKMGFAVPLAAWFRGPLREYARDRLRGERLADCGFLDRDAVVRILEEHDTGLRDRSAAIWSLLMFDAFLANAATSSVVPPRLSGAQAGSRLRPAPVTVWPTR